MMSDGSVFAPSPEEVLAQLRVVAPRRPRWRRWVVAALWATGLTSAAPVRNAFDPRAVASFLVC